MSRSRRFVALAGVAASQLRYSRARTVFAVLGVAFAVLAVTLFVGVGVGVQSTGEELLNRSQADLWVSGGPIEVRPSSVGGFQNPIVDAHKLSQNLTERPGVDLAVPMAFQVVYIGPNESDLRETMGTGLVGGVQVRNGSGFRNSPTHYAGGDYDGPMTHEVIVGPTVARRYNLSINDTLHIGGTINTAKRNEFTVVGISSTFDSLLGTGTVTLHLAELQTLTGTAYNDRATLISVHLKKGADRTEVKQAIQQAHPDLRVRTNREQFVAVLERQAVVIVGGISLVVLGVLAGVVLSANMFLSLTYAQRRDYMIFRAVGGSGWSVLAIGLVQATLIAGVGAVSGLAATPVAAVGLNAVAAAVTGFGPLVKVPLGGYLLGSGVAVVFGVVGTVVAVRQLAAGDITRTLET